MGTTIEGMAPEEIRKALRVRDVRQTAIADAVGKSKQLVTDVINRARRNEEIEREIAARIGRSVSHVWGGGARVRGGTRQTPTSKVA